MRAEIRAGELLCCGKWRITASVTLGRAVTENHGRKLLP